MNTIDLNLDDEIGLNWQDLSLQDPILQDARKRFCNKTGKPLDPVDEQTVSQLIEVHGIERAIMIMQSCRLQVDPVWMVTDDKALKRLALLDTKGYLIYSLNFLLFRPNSQKNTALANLIADQRIKAWENLQSIPETKIADLAELVRRVLSHARPLALSDSIRHFDFATITSCVEEIDRFAEHLRGILSKIANRWYDPGEIAKRDAAQQAYILQKSFRYLSELELQIGRELAEIEILPSVKPTNVEARIGTKYGKIANKLKDYKYDGRPHSMPKTGFKLNLGSKK